MKIHYMMCYFSTVYCGVFYALNTKNTEKEKNAFYLKSVS